MNILSIDYGTKNIGLAWCDTGLNVVLPYGVVDNFDKTKAKNDLAGLIKQEKIQKVVIGLPISLDGKENENTKRIKLFGEELKKIIEADIVYFDERFSSQQADHTVGGVSRDEKSAMIILEGFLEKFHK